MTPQKHKYLEQIIPSHEIVQNWYPDDERQKYWEEQRTKYGFDDRETWAMGATFTQWLYERLRMYKDVGGQIVNLSYHSFDVDGVEMTQLEIIDKMLSNCEILLREEDLENEETIEQETARLWSIVLPAMWW